MSCIVVYFVSFFFFFFKQKTAYEMRISDWSSDVCSSDLSGCWQRARLGLGLIAMGLPLGAVAQTALQVKEQRTLSYPRAIGRVEVDREGVLSIAAPSARSLRLTAIGEGAATVSVYGGDGGLMAREPISVAPDAAPRAPIAIG